MHRPPDCQQALLAQGVMLPATPERHFTFVTAKRNPLNAGLHCGAAPRRRAIQEYVHGAVIMAEQVSRASAAMHRKKAFYSGKLRHSSQHCSPPSPIRPIENQ